MCYKLSSLRWAITTKFITKVFHTLEKPNFVKIANDCFVLGSGLFLLLPQMPQKIMITSKMVKRS